MSPTDSDMVNHPPHYTQGPIHDVCGEPVECITVTEQLNFNVGNAVKYLWRHGSKGDALQDLEKARWYVSREIDRLKYERAREAEQQAEQARERRWAYVADALKGPLITGATYEPGGHMDLKDYAKLDPPMVTFVPDDPRSRTRRVWDRVLTWLGL